LIKLPGGGGKGMQLRMKKSLNPQMKRAISEAMFLEMVPFYRKICCFPRHIETQIMADSHGNILYLFERELASPSKKSSRRSSFLRF
jgi:propionyl-CoA carboxylase alpha chain